MTESTAPESFTQGPTDVELLEQTLAQNLDDTARRFADGSLDPGEVLRRDPAIGVADSGLWQHLAVDALPVADRYVVKPNASSASWGVSAVKGWHAVRDAVLALHAEGHDAIVEPFITGHDVEMSVITVEGRPLILPTMIVEQEDPAGLRSYGEKRNLAAGDQA